MLQRFEAADLTDPQDNGARSVRCPVRSEGKYAVTENPWPRNEDQEARDFVNVQKRKMFTPRGPSNRWDQYGEDSSATSSEAHIVSDSANAETKWGPCEQASREKRRAQPYQTPTGQQK